MGQALFLIGMQEKLNKVRELAQLPRVSECASSKD